MSYAKLKVIEMGPTRIPYSLSLCIFYYRNNNIILYYRYWIPNYRREPPSSNLMGGHSGDMGKNSLINFSIFIRDLTSASNEVGYLPN